MKPILFSEVAEYHERLQQRPLSIPGRRLPKVAYEGGGGILFITRADGASTKPYLVHRQLVNGTVVTAHEPCNFPALGEARARIKALHN
jgi:hypothetical protein